MPAKLTTYDPADDLTSDAAIATFMAEAFASADPGYIPHALGIAARAKGVAQIARQTGLTLERLYRSFSENGNPTPKTTMNEPASRESHMGSGGGWLTSVEEV